MRSLPRRPKLLALTRRVLRGRRGTAALAGAVLLTGTCLAAVPLTASLAASSPACAVAYSVTSTWPGGFGASITITNNGPAITSWTLAFTFPGNQQVTSGWNGTWSQSGENVTVTSESWNGALATGGSTSIGFNGSVSGANANPTTFTLNGTACTGGSPPPSSPPPSSPPPTSPPPSSPPPSSPPPSSPPPGVTLATGDSRQVSQPSIPAACTTLTAQLATSNEQFSSSAEQSPPDTSRLQSALNSCAGTGKAVVLATGGSNNAFLSGPLTLPGGVTLLIDSGVTLYASRNPANYQISGKNACGTVASSDNGCQPFINVTGSNAAIMGTQGSGGQGAINGRGDQDILGTSTTWWALAQQAKSSGGSQNNPRLIEARGVNNLTLYDVDLINAPIFHLYFESGNGLTVWGTRIDTPATARNTDGIDADSAANVTVNNSYIMDGDDGIAIKTNSGAASNMTVENSHFYGTHGMSIGSETNHGVTNILFTNNTVSGVDSAGNVSTDDNGVRIKTDSSVGGTVEQVTYQNTCVTQAKHAMEFNPFYASGNGSTTPYFTDIAVLGFRAVSSQSSAQSVLEGYDSAHPLGLTLENVDLDATSTSAEYASIAAYNSNISPSGTDVTVTNISGSGGVPSCTFPPFPGR
jgi:polygalacturonase